MKKSKFRNWFQDHGGFSFLLLLVAVIGIPATIHAHEITCGNYSYSLPKQSQPDSNNVEGYSAIIQEGSKGVKYECIRQGDQTTISSKVTTPAVAEVDSYGTAVTSSDPEPIEPDPRDSTVLPTPSSSTVCEVTLCGDGSCSFSTGRGTCSHHGGEAY